MGNIRELIRNINKGKNLQENIPIYQERLSALYEQMALLRLTMEYYVLYETLQDSEGKEKGYLSEVIKVVNQVAKEACSDEDMTEKKREELLLLLEKTREEVIAKMKILTMYTDRLAIYEHVINRVELKFENEYALTDVDMFAKKVCQYIFNGKDNVVVNENIKEVLGELPVRMARSKYFQLIENSMSVYKDSDKSSVDRFVYMLETSAMLYEPEGTKEYFEEIREFSERMAKVQFSALADQEFRMIYDELQKNAMVISEIADLYVGIQNVLNSMYCYLASKNKDKEMSEAEEACLQVITTISHLFADGKWQDIPAEAEEQLVFTEGKQEEISDDLMKLEGILEELTLAHKEELISLGMEEHFERLKVVQQLISAAGTFVELHQVQNTEPADEAYIAQETSKLIDKLKNLFANSEMCIVRAIIAATISKFPVFFTSSKEVEEYVLDSLQRCSDDAERQASINVIEDIMTM